MDIDQHWDGIAGPYDPSGRELEVPDHLKLHRDIGDSLDPITFEIVANKLWNLNEQHADAIKRVSGAPIVVYNDDFNTSLVREDGEPILFGPYIQYFAGAAPLIVKYTLENRGDSPGIEAGDVFVHNDPLIGGSHQMDLNVYAPVFIDGQIFCWVFSTCHVRDNGGIEPGGFCVQARTIYEEPPIVRALKIADRDGIRRDVEDTMLRMSRAPHLYALELRSQIVGANRTVELVRELVGRYRPETVKGVMEKIVDDAERAATDRLRRLPDGRWQDVVYTSGAAPGDKQLHKQVLTLEKRGTRLTFSNRGTDPEFAAHNCGFGQFCAGIASALATSLAFDHNLCVGGVLRLTEFEAEQGTMTCASREGAVTGTHSQISTVYQAAQVLGRMLYPDPELRRGVMAVSALAASGWLAVSGTDQFGNWFGQGTLEVVAGGMGASTDRDGIDHGGAIFWPRCEVQDCEINEYYHPLLYLYRRTARNGGHGKFRGGRGVEMAWTGHRTSDTKVSTTMLATGLPVQAGLHGGHWAQTALGWTAADTDLRQIFASGRLPGTREELHQAAPEGRPMRSRETGIPLGEDDVIELSTYGGGGYGDPLRRDPEAVAADRARGAISPRSVERVYGVVLDANAAPDLEATRALRERMAGSRLASARRNDDPLPSLDQDAVEICELADGLGLARRADGAYVFHCRHCRTEICDSESNYKERCAVLDGSLVDVDADLFTDPDLDLEDERVTYRSFLCPACGLVLERQITPVDAPPSWDTWIDVATLVERVGVTS